MSEKPPGWLLAMVADTRNWNASDHLSGDELHARLRACPVFGSDEHRLLSTILLLQTELFTLKAL